MIHTVNCMFGIPSATWRMRIKLAFVLACFTVCANSLAEAKRSDDEQVRQLVERYDDAWNHRDAAVIERFLAPEYVYFSSKGAVRSRESMLEQVLSVNYQLVAAERTEVKVYLTSNTAIVSSRWKGHGTYNGQHFRDDQRCSMVLARKRRAWMVLAEHCTQVAAQ